MIIIKHLSKLKIVLSIFICYNHLRIGDNMKYIKYLLLPILLVPFIVLAETKNVEIKSISNYVDKSDAAEELEKPNIEGLKLGFKLKFTKQDDFIKYKFIIKNNTDKDYEIDNSSTFNEKKFIRYDYEVENNAKIMLKY